MLGSMRKPTSPTAKQWLTVGLLYLILATAATVGSAEIMIRGKVTADGTIAAGARVSLHRLSGTFERGELRAKGLGLPAAVAEAPTDPRGLFEIAAPEIGMWTVRVEAPAHAPAEFRIQPLLQETQLPTVDLKPSTDLTVNVRQGQDQPVRARVMVYRLGTRFMETRTPDYQDDKWNLPIAVGQTNDKGQLVVPVSEKGNYFVRVTAPGLVAAEKELKTASKVNFDLVPGRSRKIRAVTADQRGVAGALVFEHTHQLPLGRTDDAGRITLAQGDKPLRLHFSSVDGHTGDNVVEPRDNSQLSAEGDDEKAEILVTLDPPKRLTGRVIDAESRAAVAGALVWISGRSGNFALADATGVYELRTSGEFQGVWAAAPRYATAFERVSGKRPVTSQGTTLALMPAAIVGGRVVNLDGDPVEGVEVKASIKRDMSNPMRMMRMMRTRIQGDLSRTTPQGGFQFSSLPAGADYQLQFKKDGFADHDLGVETLRPFERRTELHVVLERGRLGFGRVVDTAGEPVAGATVRLTPRQTDPQSRMMQRVVISFADDETGPKADAFTDADGRYEIPDLAAGTYDLAVESNEFSRAAIPGIEVPEAIAEMDLGTVVLEPGVSITGRVTTAEGQPLPRAEIRVGKDEGMPVNFLSFQLGRKPPRAHTNAKGEFQVGGLREGEKVHVLVKHTGFVDATVAGVVAPTTEPLAIVMKPASKVRGRVLDDEGRPVKEAMVTVSIEGMRGIGARGRSLADGSFEVVDVAPGRVSVSAQADGYQDYRIGGLEIAEGVDLTDVELTLSQGSTVHGTVFTADGRPVIGASVKAVEPGSSNRFSFGREMSDGDGNYWLDGLPNERHTIIAEFENQRVARDIEIEKGTNKLDLIFEGGVDVSGVVVGPQGGPLEEVLVQLQSGEGFFSMGGAPQATTQADGTFNMVGVQPGQYTLQAGKEGYATAKAPESVAVGQESVSGLEIQLTTGATLVGTITGLSVDELAELTITAFANRDFRGGGEVNFEGRYEVLNLAPGEWRVNAQIGRTGRSTSGKVTVTEDDLEVNLDLEFGSGYTLTGTVLVSDQPMVGAWIFASGKDMASTSRATTNQDGTFSIENLEQGTYNLTVTSANFSGLRHNEEVEVTGDDDILIELVTTRVSGWVVDAFDRTPLADARVSFQAADGDEKDGVFLSFGGGGNTSDSRGYFTLQEVPEGSWRVVAKRNGYGPAEQALEVDGSAVGELELEMSPTEGLFFEVAFATGGSPPRVSAAVLKKVGGDGSDVVVASDHLETGENGRVRMTEVPPGSFELLVAAPGTATVALPVVSPNQLGRITLPLSGAMKITVQELVEKPASAKVDIVSSSGTPYRQLQWGRIQTQVGLSSGVANVIGLEPGSWNVTITTDDGRTWSRQVQIAGLQVAEVVFE